VRKAENAKLEEQVDIGKDILAIMMPNMRPRMEEFIVMLI